jgi:aldehyde dehydrogenase
MLRARPGARPRPPSAPRCCNKIADRIEENLDMLALVETIDNGKPIRETTAADLPLAVDHFRYFAGASAPRRAAISEIDTDTVAYHFHEPLGVVGADHPLEFPAADGGVEARPRAGRRQLRGAQAGRADADVASLVLMDMLATCCRRASSTSSTGFGVEAGKPLAQSSRIAKVAFTGETTTGRLIMQYASQNLIPVTLELGGKSAEHLLRT